MTDLHWPRICRRLDSVSTCCDFMQDPWVPHRTPLPRGAPKAPSTSRYPATGGSLACDGRCRRRERERPSTRLDLHPGLRPANANCLKESSRRTIVPVAHLQARAPTTIRPAVLDPISALRVATLPPSPSRCARSATALRARPQTAVRFAWSSAVRNPTRTTLEPAEFSCGAERSSLQVAGTIFVRHGG